MREKRSAFLVRRLKAIRRTRLVAQRLDEPARMTLAPAAPPPVSGFLRVSLCGPSEGKVRRAAGSGDPLLHRGTWVRGAHYTGHFDNDLRGFLDGRFLLGLNQASQIHVRVGRLEREIFRNLHLWRDIHLSAGARVTTARMEIDVERGFHEELDLLLYEVKKEWNPGQGGVARNNGSPPAPGEVWWNESMRNIRTWSLPGAGFASDTHPDADTPVTPLARTRYRPGDATISFESARFARYVDERVSVGEPLRLLLKVSDYQEDTVEAALFLYSAEHGDSRNTARRPRLSLEWMHAHELHHAEEHVILEHGRSSILPRMAVEGTASISVTFMPDEGYGSPEVWVRGGRREEVSEWIYAARPVMVDWDWVEVRLDTHFNPTPFGRPFTATLRDTWVRTGPPEEQDVTWVFVSPSGRQHEARAEYVGDHSWKVEFTPYEFGRWRYVWRQRFIDVPYESAVGVFDVVADDRATARAALERLIDRMEAVEGGPGQQRIRIFGEEFQRIQRAIMRLEGAGSFPLDAEPGNPGHVWDLLDVAHEALTGRRPQGSRLDLES